MRARDPFAPARAVADAVLYEGYVLYPYRASADKNRLRWQWGVVGPAGAHGAGVGEEPSMRADLPVECDGTGSVRLRLRFLRVVTRRVELHADAVTEVPSVTVGDQTYVSFDDTEEHTVETELVLADTRTRSTGFEIAATTEVHPLGSVDGDRFRRVRRGEHISGTLETRWEPVGAGAGVLHVEVVNTTPWHGGDRDDATLRSLVGAHVLGVVDRGSFVSTLDPPARHVRVVAACAPHRLWPVLVGAAGRAPLVLASPVILYDQPEIAPESPGSFHDGLEIDELLSLRVMTMTDDEKAEARATDPRSAAIVDMVEAMRPEDLARLHGAIRSPDGSSTPPVPWWDPGADASVDPDTDSVVVAGTSVSRGSVVRLHPGTRSDAHDIFYRGRTATVAAVLHDVDGSTHVAVTIDDDPAADLNDATGRYLYFHPDEIEPLDRRMNR